MKAVLTLLLFVFAFATGIFAEQNFKVVDGVKHQLPHLKVKQEGCACQHMKVNTLLPGCDCDVCKCCAGCGTGNCDCDTCHCCGGCVK
jgi:hypothetical protein